MGHCVVADGSDGHGSGDTGSPVALLGSLAFLASCRIFHVQFLLRLSSQICPDHSLRYGVGKAQLVERRAGD